MRKLVTAAAVALTVGLGAASPALADGQYGQTFGHNNHGQQSQSYGQYNDDDQDLDAPYQPSYQDQRAFDGRGDRFRDDRGAWERSWRPWQDHREYSRFEVLPRWKLIRKLERQGFYDIRDLRPSRFGQGWRAFARTGRGAFVILRVNPHNGRVLDVHRV